ncbi:hypothetical protein Tco_1388011 [Tanacetum coccineum]
MYPFPEVDKELASLMGYMYKCFLRLPNGYRQIRMSEGDEEKTRFQTEEGVYCFTHVPKELKNSAATLQRMAEKVLADQNGRNVEVYLEEIVVKSRSEQSLIQDNKLRRVNVKIDPSKCTFGLEESKFLGFVLKLAELMHPIRNVQRSSDAKEGSNWTSEAEEALQKIKRRLNKLQALTILKEREALMICLQQGSETVSSVLFVERGGVQTPVSYVPKDDFPEAQSQGSNLWTGGGNVKNLWYRRTIGKIGSKTENV